MRFETLDLDCDQKLLMENHQTEKRTPPRSSANAEDDEEEEEEEEKRSLKLAEQIGRAHV